MSKIRVLVGITGSIGILNMPVYLQYLQKGFFDTKVIMTDSAKRFIPEETFSLVVGSVYSKLFPFSSIREASHVELARWADLFIVLPATANILAEAANGLSRSLLSSTILCHQKPVLFFPSMNELMWEHPATQKNIATLKEYGHKIIPPQRQMGFEYASGELKEGDYMPSFEEILSIIQEEVQSRSNEDLLAEFNDHL